MKQASIPRNGKSEETQIWYEVSEHESFHNTKSHGKMSKKSTLKEYEMVRVDYT